MTMDRFEEETHAHIALVSKLLYYIARELYHRANVHDRSKLLEPERSVFAKFSPLLGSAPIDSAAYEAVLSQMGEALQHHYRENRHHPEHFPEGIRGMNLVDFVEMVCDWTAAAYGKGELVNLEWAADRFHLSRDEALLRIIRNTLGDLSGEAARSK